MVSFLIAATISLALIIACAATFYEVLAHVWVNLPRLEGRPRAQILLTILATFLAHTLVVWIFGIAMYVLDRQFQFGSLSGTNDTDLFEYLYFSGVSYSSLGFGNIDATGGLQLLVVVESVLGLTFIGWSVAFSYIVTEKYLFHRRRPEE